MTSGISGTGFFGKGHWGRKTYWFSIPSKWREIDANYGGNLEKLLNVFGDFSESFLDQIALLPSQRDPYLVRSEASDGVWIYVTSSMQWDDDVHGKVVRLIEEREYAEMPETDEDAPPVTSDSELAEWYPWFPYKPLESVGRWWYVRWQGALYEVVNVRSRNYDPPALFKGSSVGNEVWVGSGDLVLVFDYLNNKDFEVLSEGDGSQSPAFELPILPVRLMQNDTASPTPWLVADAKVQVRLALGSAISISGISHANPAEITTSAPHGLSGTQDVYISGVEGMQIDDGFYQVTSTGISTLTIDGLNSSNLNPYTGGGSLYELTTLYDVPDGVGERGHLYPEDGVSAGEIDTSVSYGDIDYLSGRIVIDLSLTGLFSTIGIPIGAKWIVRGYFMRFFEAPLIDYLAEDFGIENDRNDPDATQRSAIANVTKYLGLKATQDSYRIRGAISLFDVFMRSLWRICDSVTFSKIPADHKFEIDSKYYADVPPLFIRFDDIRGDEQYYDDDSSTWMTLLDNDFMSADDLRWNGLSIGQSYALDVTQGYYGKVSPFNSNARTYAEVSSVTVLTDLELSGYNLVGGYRVVIQMQRCQGLAFLFSNGKFALTKYSVGTPPAIDDELLWIDEQVSQWELDSSPTADPEEDIGFWEVIVGTESGGAAPFVVGDYVSVRYFPTVKANCCYCKSSYLRGEIEATDDAYDHYDTPEAIDGAVERMKLKLLKPLAPIHTRVIEWLVTRRYRKIMSGVQNGAVVEQYFDGSEFDGHSGVLLTVEVNGDLDVIGKAINLKVEEETSPGVWTPAVWDTTGFFDGLSNDTWRVVVSDFDASSIVVGGNPIRCSATASALSTFGGVRFTFRVSMKES